MDSRRVAVEHNLVILKRHLFPETMIGDGDRIEMTQSAVVLENLIGQLITSKAGDAGSSQGAKP